MRSGSEGFLPTVEAQTPTWMASCSVERGHLSHEPELQDPSAGLLLKRTSNLTSKVPSCHIAKGLHNCHLGLIWIIFRTMFKSFQVYLYFDTCHLSVFYQSVSSKLLIQEALGWVLAK